MIGKENIIDFEAKKKELKDKKDEININRIMKLAESLLDN